jgi:hypothetical protein
MILQCWEEKSLVYLESEICIEQLALFAAYTHGIEAARVKWETLKTMSQLLPHHHTLPATSFSQHLRLHYRRMI